ncbi:hypothetical protein [Roseimicrobium sp. ORNL1]|uniref:hypothetical protein n=1 Tax=Roseimicrobium sp. ORNL1 TaxID=2711231 RepID=UPI0013E1175F|nr:hypothetical protein [Roseimicrobium sp. ORNL1]QIF03228.1 hypothetical protein G5S37_17425 [Roseimicrobium sp. ORNL1]
MKTAFSSVTVLILASLATSFAESPMERELSRLKEQREKALTTAAEPINRRYRDELQKLLRQASDDKDATAAALVIQAMNTPLEFESQHTDVLKFLMASNWGIKGASDVFEFRLDGSIAQLGGGWKTKSWKLAKDGKSVRVEYEKNGYQDWTISGGVMYHPTLGAFQPLPKPAKIK